MTADDWHNNGPQDLITVSLRIQIAIAKIKLCSLSVRWLSVHNVDISKPISNTNALHAFCHLPGTVETGIHL
jgi:hypothetical protein